MEKKTKIYIGIAAVLAVGGIYYFSRKNTGAGATALKTASAVSVSATKDSQISGKVDALIDKGLKNLDKIMDEKGKKDVTPQKIAEGKAMIKSKLPTAISKLTDKEKDIAIDGLVQVDVLLDKMIADGKKGNYIKDPMVIFGYLGKMQEDLSKKYSKKEMEDFAKKLETVTA